VLRVPNESMEVRFIKIELAQETHQDRLNKLELRADALEKNHNDQVSILMKLGQTVETLAQTVSTLSELTKELDKSQEVFKARFNIIIGILSTIGIAVVAGVVKLLFFSGGVS
jgi:iron-sulfur cluster repair protein YtfE (RIC family)